MLSAGLALESHNHNFVYPTVEHSTAQYNVHELASTTSSEIMCASSLVVHENEQKKTQRNLQQHQLHAQFLHEQYLAQQIISSASLVSPSSSSSSPSSPLLSSSSSTTFDFFGKSTFVPPSTAVLENWRNDLLFITSASDSISQARKTTSSASNATCTITSGSFQSMKQSSYDSNLTSNSTISEIDNNHKFLVPKVPNKTSASANRNTKKEQQQHYSQLSQKNDPSSKLTPSKHNESGNTAKPSMTKPLDKSNLKISETKNALKIPTGKEGSLKHRILTSFSPEKEENLDEPEDLSLKNVKKVITSVPETTKACPISSLPLSLPFLSLTSPSSSTASIHTMREIHSEPKKRKRTKKIEFKKAHRFLKGLSIKMDNGTIRKIEDMTTEDFLQSIDLRPDLMISNLAITSMSADLLDSTHNKINVTGQFKGSNKKKEISIKRSDPFFVYGSGWASYDPELTKTVYGADCRKLSAGDVIIMLKNKTKSLSLSSLSNKKSKNKRPATIPTLTLTKPAVLTVEPNNNHSQNVVTNNKQKKENEMWDHKVDVGETEAVAITTAETFENDCSTPTKKKKHISSVTRNSYPSYPQTFHQPSPVPFDLQIQAQLLQQQQDLQQQQQQQQQHYHSSLFPHSNPHFPQPFAYSPYAYHPYPLSYQQFYFPQTSITHHTHISNAISHENESNLK